MRRQEAFSLILQKLGVLPVELVESIDVLSITATSVAGGGISLEQLDGLVAEAYRLRGPYEIPLHAFARLMRHCFPQINGECEVEAMVELHPLQAETEVAPPVATAVPVTHGNVHLSAWAYPFVYQRSVN